MATTREAPIILRAADGGMATVEPHDQDRFCMAINSLVSAAQARTQVEEFKRQLSHLVPRVGEWAAREPDIADSLFVPRGGRVLFVAFHRGTEFNVTLAERLAELEFEIAQDPSLGLIKFDTFAMSAYDDPTSILGDGFTFKYAK